MQVHHIDPRTIKEIAVGVFGRTAPLSVERVTEGVSTVVYRIRRKDEVYYLRVLPEVDAGFAPEAYVHALLRERGVSVPKVIYVEHCNAALERSVMVTTEIKGCHPGYSVPDDRINSNIRRAGRELAIINSITVDGFGWIVRDEPEVAQLRAEHPTFRAFVYDQLDDDLAVIGTRLLGQKEIAAIRAIIEGYSTWLEIAHACLVHGDFDVTHIYQHKGRYSGIIDFGEIRGADQWYDLGHFKMRDGERLSARVLPYLIEGYAEIAPLPRDYEQRIALASLIIAVKALARHLHKGRSSDADDVVIRTIKDAIGTLSI